MPEALSAALAHEELALLAGVVFVAGLVRGFAGFGTALIYLPVAGALLSPVWAILTVVIFDLFGPALILRRALRDAQPGDLMRLVLGCVVGLPVGLALLFALSPDFFRLTVSMLSVGMVVALILGVRYRGRLSPGLLVGTGTASGFLGGVAGIPGPPVILLYMASPLSAATVRGTITAFLFFYDLMILGLLLGAGRMTAEPVWIGLILAVPNALGNLTGAAIFRPGHDRVYRAVAYAIITASALTGLSALNG